MSWSIGIVCFPSLGGSGVIATELAAGLAARGHDVHLIASALPARIDPPPARVTFHEVRVPGYPLFDHAPYGMAVASKILDVGGAYGLDLVHAHYALPHAASAVLARQLLGAAAPVVATSLHGTDVTHTGSDPSYRAITSAAVAASDGIAVPSEWLRREAMARLDLPAGTPIEILPNFVDTDRFAPPARRDPAVLRRLFPADETGGPVLFHVSNFRPVKRTAELPEILAMVRRRLPARLVLVGDGPEREAVEARVHELGLCGSVRFLGARDEFADELRHADAFVLPSESESFGLAALEALASGVPVFAYRVGGLEDLVTPEVGALVDPFDAKGLAQTIVEAIGEPGRPAQLGEAARTRSLERFRRDVALDRYEDWYRRLLSRRHEDA